LFQKLHLFVELSFRKNAQNRNVEKFKKNK
jgi:hypothetical protein